METTDGIDASLSYGRMVRSPGVSEESSAAGVRLPGGATCYAAASTMQPSPQRGPGRVDPRADIACATSTTAERLNDDDLVGHAQRLRQVANLLAVDEDANVAPYPVLLVDHAEADTGILAVQVGEDRRECCAGGHGLAGLGVRTQRARDEHLHPRKSRLRQRGRFHRVDFRQMPRDAGPALAFVPTHPQFAAGGAEVQANGLSRVRAHRLALHGPPRLALRQAGVETLPGFSAIARRVDRRFAVRAGARPDGLPVHREYPCGIGIARMEHHREADVADPLRHGLADAHPFVGRPVDPVDAAVILLVQPVRVAWAEAHTMRIVDRGVGPVEALNHFESSDQRRERPAAVDR